jgi:8-amino-3,8-dideoxy-alpha-D-manno-octulosonate transaminase
VSASGLAIDGGKPARTRPLPPAMPGAMMIAEEEKQAVMRVLEDRNLFRFYGPSDQPSRVLRFEEALAEHLGARHALAVTSGTAALHTALVGLGVGPGDEVIVPAYTFIASAAAVIAARAVPVICDVDDSLGMDPADVERRITPRTRVLMPVHMMGASADMEGVMEVARRNGLKVLEDACQALGASHRGRRLGTIGDAGAFSLQLNKIITTGEGGVVVTSDRKVYERALIFHDDAGIFRGHEPLAEPYFAGVNYRMNELCGAVAAVQLERLEGILAALRARRTEIQRGIASTLASRGVTTRLAHDEAGEAGTSVVLYLADSETAERVAAALRAENIGAGVMFHREGPDWHVAYHWDWVIKQTMATEHGCPYACPLYDGNYQFDRESIPRTIDLLGRAVRFDLSPLLTERDSEEIVVGVNKVVEALA